MTQKIEKIKKSEDKSELNMVNLKGVLIFMKYFNNDIKIVT
jgi:hypothetical protein|tara:strand:+ start:1106 stop:1228 length:123 start_codon:yes stop_codon:yes gene_type:complete